MEKESQTIFDKNVIEFVTVAAEFCAFLERAERMKRSTFVDTSLKILPLLYLKASMLPKCETCLLYTSSTCILYCRRNQCTDTEQYDRGHSIQNH